MMFRFEKLKQNYPQEKVHLHLDKPYYSVGDTIYFKAYVVNAEKNLPSGISSQLYIDLIADDSIVKQSILLPVWNGIAWGSLALNDTLVQEGNYRIRAYTNWMRNFDEAFFFDKILPIGNAFNNEVYSTIVFGTDSSSDKKRSVAKLQYQSLNEQALAGREVSFSFLQNGKEVAKGKGVTDSSGKINIGFDPAIMNGELLTHIKTGRTTVTKRTVFNLEKGVPVIRFFPEGGQLLYGFHSKVGFKATGPDGLGIAVSGDILDSTGKKVADFASGFAGMGSFEFTPFSGNSYFARVNFGDGSTVQTKLPSPVEYGYLLQVEDKEDNQLEIKMSARQSSGSNEVLLVAQQQNTIKYMAKTTLGNAGYSGHISTKKFVTGIAQFTMFNAAMQPVAERLVFVNRGDQLNINLSADHETYGTRQPVKVAIAAKDEEDNPVSGSFSIAVTNTDKVPYGEDEDPTVLSELLLVSDLRGYIERPAYYFADNTATRKKELDNLMLTQGWRRFIWSDLMTDKFPVIKYKQEKSLTISGKVTKPTGEPVAKGKVNILARSGDGFGMDTVTAEDGSFKFDELELEGDSIHYMINATDITGSNDVKISIDSMAPQAAIYKTSAPAAAKYASMQMFTYLKNSSERFNELRKYAPLPENKSGLKEVVVKTKTVSKIEEAVAPSANLNGPGNADQVITYLDLKNCVNLGNCLQGKLTGIIFKRIYDSMSGTINLLAYSTRGFGRPMVIIVDGVEMRISGGGISLDNFPAQNIQSIEVLRSGNYLSVYGTRAAAGALIITTKQGGINYDNFPTQDNTQLKGSLFTSSKVYHSSREFYAPVYEPSVASHAGKDLRSTIFWKPDIITDEFGKASCMFYNGDVPGNYRVVLEGLSENGKLARKVVYYKVQ